MRFRTKPREIRQAYRWINGVKWTYIKDRWVKTTEVRKSMKCPDCELKLQKRSLKSHRGNRTCLARKHTQEMLDKGYKHIYSYVTTLRRLGIEVISETDAKTCVNIGNTVNTYRYGWTSSRAATIANNIRLISFYLAGRDRNRLIKQGMIDDKVFSLIEKIREIWSSINHSSNKNWRIKLSSLLKVPIHTKIWDRNSNRYHSIAINPNGSKTPCCTTPNTDSTALSVASAFGFPVPLCIQHMNANE